MKYDQWKMTRRIEEDFLKSLNFLSTLFEKIAIISGNDVNLFQSKMQIFQNSVPYDNYINDIVKRMVTPLAARNYETWRKAARVSTRSHFLYTVLMEELKQLHNSSIRFVAMKRGSAIFKYIRKLSGSCI